MRTDQPVGLGPVQRRRTVDKEVDDGVLVLVEVKGVLRDEVVKEDDLTPPATWAAVPGPMVVACARTTGKRLGGIFQVPVGLSHNK
eukprot:1919402-Lingulodinium_polyedra.AAC.1